MKRVASLLAWALFAWIAFLSLAPMVVQGDGAEYLLMSHAMLNHGSVQIRPQDFQEFFARGPAYLQAFGFPEAHFRTLLEQFHTPQPASWGGFASVAPDQLYAMHFWLYSLLALPFTALGIVCNWNPMLALGLVNVACVAVLALYLWKSFRLAPYLSLPVICLAGALWYLNWPGPEVMTACCLVAASFAAVRGDLAYGFLFAGIAAAQNPSAILFMPFLVGVRAWIWHTKAELWPGAGIAPFGRRAWLIAGLGVLIALAPYAFFYRVFGVPSLTGRYFTLPELISVQRLVSLWFDLDQGIVVALPGLWLAWCACVLVLGRAMRLRFLVCSALACCLALAMAVPVLAAINWNSGAVVLTRYGYWIVAPLAALTLLALRECAPRRQALVLACFLVPQLGMATVYGYFGERWKPTAHTPMAEWALSHHPRHYHPDPEIFYERGVGHEVNAPLAKDLSVAYTSDGKLLKVLANVAVQDVASPLCASGMRLVGSARKDLYMGWFYEHAPFHCEKLPVFAVATEWAAGAGNDSANAIFGEGWSIPEASGRWTEGAVSRLRIPVPPGATHLRIRFKGGYFVSTRETETTVGKGPAQRLVLPLAPIEVRLAAGEAGPLDVVLRHPKAASPLALGLTTDARKLAFFVEKLTLEVAE